jgi:hypothetical protein
VTNTIASATTDLEGVLMAADGTFVGASFPISTAADKQLAPTASWNGSEFVVAWEDKRNSLIYFDERTDVFGARVLDDGTVLDPGGQPLAASSVPEIDPALVSIGGTTLLAVSTFRPEAAFGAFRIGIHEDGAVLGGAGRSGMEPPVGFPGPPAPRGDTGRRPRGRGRLSP